MLVESTQQGPRLGKRAAALCPKVPHTGPTVMIEAHRATMAIGQSSPGPYRSAGELPAWLSDRGGTQGPGGDSESELNGAPESLGLSQGPPGAQRITSEGF